MNDGLGKLILPNEIERYIASLAKVYENKRQVFLRKLLVNSKIIIGEHSYDNWDGGQYGFVLRLRIPSTIFSVSRLNICLILLIAARAVCSFMLELLIFFIGC